MKKFNDPMMTVIRLSLTDVVCTSGTCYGYFCDECADCVGGYDCGIFDCGHYNGGN